MKILSFQDKGDEEYIVGAQLDEDMYQHNAGEKIQIHLRYNPWAFFSEAEFVNTWRLWPSYINENSHKNAISVLKQKSGTLCFGVIGNGLNRISGKNDEYQSNALEYKEEYDQIYSYANPV